MIKKILATFFMLNALCSPIQAADLNNVSGSQVRTIPGSGWECTPIACQSFHEDIDRKTHKFWGWDPTGPCLVECTNGSIACYITTQGNWDPTIGKGKLQFINSQCLSIK